MEEREGGEDGNQGWKGETRRGRCEANKTMGAVAVAGGEEPREERLWWWKWRRAGKKWRRKGCRKERSRSGQRSENERIGRRP